MGGASDTNLVPIVAYSPSLRPGSAWTVPYAGLLKAACPLIDWAGVSVLAKERVGAWVAGIGSMEEGSRDELLLRVTEPSSFLEW